MFIKQTAEPRHKNTANTLLRNHLLKSYLKVYSDVNLVLVAFLLNYEKYFFYIRLFV